jgi:hypothetical protein
VRRRRPAGALCVRCRYRPARLDRRWPHLATSWCSEECRAADERDRLDPAADADASRIRMLLGLPDDNRSRWFTRAELAAIARRLERLVPPGGLRRYPARRRPTSPTRKEPVTE